LTVLRVYRRTINDNDKHYYHNSVLEPQLVLALRVSAVPEWYDVFLRPSRVGGTEALATIPYGFAIEQFSNDE
jgi:hypothetical protein